MNKIFLIAAAFALVACDEYDLQPRAATGVKKASAQVQTQADGLTYEQGNTRRRLEQENLPGSIKHLYVLSAYSGDVILYSTVKGKVTSSGKRLTPTSVESTGEYNDGFPVTIGGWTGTTTEVLQDDGTYGSSIEYLYWWDTQDRYHQHYPGGGQIIHISDQPIGARKAIINMENIK